MSGKKQNKRSKKVAGADTPVILLLPIMAVVGIVPLIVRLHVYDCGLENFDFFLSPEGYKAIGGASADLFLYWKMIWFTVFAGIMAVVVLFKLLIEGKKIRYSAILTPLAVYAVLALLSSVLSEYRYFSFHGIYEQFESLWALLGYCLVVYYAYLFVNTARDMKAVLWALAFSTVILLLIGMSQAFFTDFYKTGFAAKLISPKEYRESPLEFKFEEGRVYLSLYNPNYVGSYSAVLMPLFLMLVFAAEKVWVKIGCGAITVSLVLVLLGSGSRAGLIGTFVSVIMLAVVFNKRLFRHWAACLVAAVLIAGTVFAYGKHTDFALAGRLKAAFHPPVTTVNLSSIQTLDDEVVITYKDNVLHAIMEYDQMTGDVFVSMFDDSGCMLPTDADPATLEFRLSDERFPNFKVMPILLTDTQVGFELTIDGHRWYVAKIDNSFYLYSPYGRFVKTVDTESVDWLVNRSRAFSGRAYIWGKTIPLLKHYVLIGSGADTFSIIFPNYDFVSMYNGGYGTQTITKPHNMYLQMAVQTGVLSVIAFLVFYVWFFVYGLATLLRVKKYDFMAFTGAGILSGTAGYMVVQIINDSSITVAPIYWALVGLGIAAFAFIRRSSLYEAPVKKDAQKAGNNTGKK